MIIGDDDYTIQDDDDYIRPLLVEYRGLYYPIYWGLLQIKHCSIMFLRFLMWVKQCHNLAMTGEW